MPNLTLYDFYNPSIVSISGIIMGAAFILQLCMLPFILVVILRKSEMGAYRWYILNEALWSTILCFTLALISPVFLGVKFVVVINSPIANWFDIGIWFTIIDFLGFLIPCTFGALANSILYR